MHVWTTCVIVCKGIFSSRWSLAMGDCVPSTSRWEGQGTMAASGETTCLSPSAQGTHIEHMFLYISTDRPSYWWRPPSLFSWRGWDEAAGAVCDCMSIVHPICLDFAAACVCMYTRAACIRSFVCVPIRNMCLPSLLTWLRDRELQQGYQIQTPLSMRVTGKS